MSDVPDADIQRKEKSLVFQPLTLSTLMQAISAQRGEWRWGVPGPPPTCVCFNPGVMFAYRGIPVFVRKATVSNSCVAFFS